MSLTSPSPQTWALDVALVHHPIISKDQQVITTSVTNLDIHDIARSCRTFGVRRYFIVTPLELQVRLVQKILRHWDGEEGQIYNTKRRSALSLVQLAPSLEAVQDIITAEHAVNGQRPCTITTAAQRGPKTIAFHQLLARECSPAQWQLSTLPRTDKNLLLVFGTGWGLHPSVLEQGDEQLDPIVGLAADSYNHLSVRSAVAIYLAQVSEFLSTQKR